MEERQENLARRRNYEDDKTEEILINKELGELARKSTKEKERMNKQNPVIFSTIKEKFQ